VRLVTPCNFLLKTIVVLSWFVFQFICVVCFLKLVEIPNAKPFKNLSFY
jgi:hypothetical protein